MITNLQIDKAVSKILYSVIETGVCRIVTCQQPKVLSQVKSVYKKNLPLDHSALWLPSNIDSIEQLSLILSEKGLPDISLCSERHELVQQIRDYLVLCQQQGRLEIWIFESAEFLSSEVYELLGDLVNSEYSDKALFSFELWGGAQLDANYHSGQLQVCCCAQYYYIPVGQQVLQAAKPKLPHRTFTASLIIFALGVLLGNGYFYISNINIFDTVNLVANDRAGTVVKPLDETIIEQTPELITNDMTRSTLEPVVETTLEQTTEPVIETTLEQTSEPVIETILEQTPEPVIEIVLEQTSESVVEKMLEQTSEPVIETMLGQTSESVIETMLEQTSEPVIETMLEQTSEPVIETLLEQTSEPINYDIAGSAIGAVDAKMHEQTPKLSIENTPTITNSEHKLTLNADVTNSKHWFYSLSYPQWRERHQIIIHDDIDRQNGLYYLQLGIYRRQGSLNQFFNQHVVSAQTYYFCYLEKDNVMALITGTYTSTIEAYKAHKQLLTQGLESSVVAVTKYNQWQCSTS